MINTRKLENDLSYEELIESYLIIQEQQADAESDCSINPVILREITDFNESIGNSLLNQIAVRCDIVRRLNSLGGF